MKWLLILALMIPSCCPCPVKKTVVVKHVHHYHKKPKPAATPAAESLQSKRFPIPDEPQHKLIGQPEPQPTP